VEEVRIEASEGLATFTVENVNNGYWAYPSPASAPDGFATTIQNIDLPGGIPTSMPGDGVYIDTAIDTTSVITLAVGDYIPTAGGTPVVIVGSSLGKVYKWTGSVWLLLRNDFATSGIWWSHAQYGTDLFIANATDGLWRFNNDTLVPVGAKPIAQCESDEASLWSGETADTTNFKEGLQSFYVESAGSPATMTFTPATDFDAVSGRSDNDRDYETDKSPGTDHYHFKVMFNNTGTIDTANTKVVITDTAAKSLTWAYTLWDSDRNGTTLTNPPVAGTWYDVYLPAADATESATFNASIIDTFAFTVDTSAGTLRMHVDDIYVIYDVTMPACQIVVEWKNILWGLNSNAYRFSKVGAPDTYDVLAVANLKSGGESIQGAARFYNQLTIGTDTHVFSLSGSIIGQTYPAYLFDVNEITDEFGISSHRSIVKGNNLLFWLWKRQICEYNGVSVKKTSYQIDPYFDVLDETAYQFVVGAPFRLKNQIWWTWRRSGQSVNDRALKFDLKFGAFLPVVGLTTPVVFRTFSSGTERLLTVDETSRKVYAQNHASNLSFVGSSIEYVLELPPCNIPGHAVEWLLAWLQWLSNTGDMSVQYRQADTLLGLVAASYTTAETITMTAEGEYGKNRIGDRAAWLQVRFASTATKMQLQAPFIIKARGLPLGFVRVTP